MKTLLVIAMLAALGGCAVAPPGPAYGGGYGQRGDPSQWRVVSVTPVEAGTAARVASTNPDGRAVEYSSAPVVGQQAPVYVPVQPYPYYPEPAYYYPPVSLSLGFVFGRHWSSGRSHRHHHRRR